MSNDAFVEHVRELLPSIADLRFRKMFGGVGVYSGASIFALIVEEQLYLKTDESTRPLFEAAGSSGFTYDPGGGRKPVVMSYWRLPAQAEDDPEDAQRWAALALNAALAKPTPKRRAGPAKHDLGPGPWDE